MKRCFAVSLLCLFLALGAPVLAVSLRSGRPAAVPAAGLPTPPLPDASAGDAVPESPAPLSADQAAVFPVLRPSGETEYVAMADYLPGVLAGEMPASFHPQALRAQAVAARTYILCRLKEGCAAHPEAAVCGDPGCCQAWRSEQELRENWGGEYEAFWQKICRAVSDTDGFYLAWEDKPILACFHSSSAGATESSAAVWSGALPYLVSVSSPETAGDVPNYVSTLRLSPDEFLRILRSGGSTADLSGPADSWLGECRLDESGRVESLMIGGEAFAGTTLRSLFSLRSAAFTLTWDGEAFLFTVTGYGHGVGMSQYGANVMAERGSGWEEILAHYYPGAGLCRWAP